jgi:hypothetical protein
MTSWIRSIFLTLSFLLLAATVVTAAVTLGYWIGPGVTELNYQGVDIRIDSTDNVIVYLAVENGEVVGRVEAGPGTQSATVAITVLDDPERVIFKGRVVAPSWFSDYLPYETGRGEQ